MNKLKIEPGERLGWEGVLELARDRSVDVDGGRDEGRGAQR